MPIIYTFCQTYIRVRPQLTLVHHSLDYNPEFTSAKHNDKIALTYGCITDIFLQLPVWDGAAISSTSITAFLLPLPGEDASTSSRHETDWRTMKRDLTRDGT
ncbi:hypothetical protein ACOMHN_039672 [Nucella lapillus]